MTEKEVKIKYKACPLKNFDTCIGSGCALYDELRLIEQEDEEPISNFSYCSIAYLPYVFDKLKATSLQLEQISEKISKL